MDSLFAALWFFLPAGLANAAPVFSGRIPVLKNLETPMDFGKSWRGVRIFGNNKRQRGFLAGVIVAIATALVQKYLYIKWGDSIHFMYDIAWIDYSMVNIWLFGALLGAGALLGDAVKSSFKRRHGIKPGHSWFPFDQSDYIIGGCLLSMLAVRLSFDQYALIFAVYLGLHLVVVYTGYRMGIRDKPI